MSTQNNNKHHRIEYIPLLKPVLRPVFPKILLACVVMSVSVVLLALFPLVINELRNVLTVAGVSSTDENEVTSTIPSSSSSSSSPSIFELIVVNFNRLTSSEESFYSLLSEISPDSFMDQEDINIISAGFKLLILLMVHSGISYLGHYLSDRAATAASNALRKEALQSILKLDWAARLSSSDINPSTQASTWLDSITAVHRIIADVITNVFPTIVNCAVTWIALFVQSRAIALGLGGTLVSMAVFAQIRHHRRKRKQRNNNNRTSAGNHQHGEEPPTESELLSNAVAEGQANTQGFLATILERFSTIKMYQGSGLIINKFYSVLDQLEQDSAKLSHHVHWTCGNGSRKLTVLYVVAGVAIVILHRHGLIGFLTDLAVVGFYGRQFVQSCQSAYEMVQKTEISFTKAIPLCKLYQAAKYDSERILTNDKNRKNEGEEEFTMKNSKLNVVIENIAATYRKNQMSNVILVEEEEEEEDNHLQANKKRPGIHSCTLKPITNRDCVFLVGKSGNGKTTLQKCIASQLKIHKGTLKIENAKIAMLSQEPILIGGCTLAENIAMKPSSDFSKEDTEKIISSAKRALCYDVIVKLRYGFETRVEGTGSISGSGLSGGQLQRVSFARLLFAEANLLLLDEPTNNLDAHTASTILKIVLEEECKKRGAAAVIVTHDKTWLGEAEKMMKRGENDVKVRVVNVVEGYCREE